MACATTTSSTDYWSVHVSMAVNVDAPLSVAARVNGNDPVKVVDSLDRLQHFTFLSAAPRASTENNHAQGHSTRHIAS